MFMPAGQNFKGLIDNELKALIDKNRIMEPFQPQTLKENESLRFLAKHQPVIEAMIKNKETCDACNLAYVAQRGFDGFLDKTLPPYDKKPGLDEAGVEAAEKRGAVIIQIMGQEGKKIVVLTDEDRVEFEVRNGIRGHYLNNYYNTMAKAAVTYSQKHDHDLGETDEDKNKTIGELARVVHREMFRQKDEEKAGKEQAEPMQPEAPRMPAIPMQRTVVVR